MEKKEFLIPFVGLKLEKHNFSFEIDNTFFESFGYQEFNGASVNVNAVLDKTATMMELDLEAKGWVNVQCDLTDEPFDQQIIDQLHLVIKFGEDYDDTNEELLVLPHGEYQVNIAQYIYELIVLAVPQKRVHPGVRDGSLRSDALDRLEELSPKESRKDNEHTDPRWDGLKKLLTDDK
ncbi:MAG: DUF177 domain-containing protein [Bacteroidota bacterium]